MSTFTTTTTQAAPRVKAFINGSGVIVSARGPGNLHLLSYASNSGLPDVYGSISAKPNVTGNDDVTRFMISDSYTYTEYAFYWDGNDEAVCGIGLDLVRSPVGTSWKQATIINFGGTQFGSGDVTSFVNKTSSVKRDNEITAFVIPDHLL
ncbi:hypothetical protein BDQ17DRAFT_1328637 [Cyathus striatus]|nr:hypothetical protein BDQ17DRAFT_1328637 [Cyathus striatus]